METASESLPAVQVEQEESSICFSAPGDDAELLSSCQKELEGAVILYDNDSQEGQVVKIITNSENDPRSSPDDLSNLITLHASSSAVKQEVLEQDIKVDSQLEFKQEPQNQSAEVEPSVEAEAEAEADTATETAAETAAEIAAETVAEAAAVAEPQPEPEPESDDDETIATFITSTGQQLALYAVEDSDEIFAVALYDESGEPPTNFHFLMKADVERLIGEGAVKTVKKPSASQGKQGKSSVKNEEIKFERVQQVPQIQQIQQADQIQQTQQVQQIQQVPQVEQITPKIEKVEENIQKKNVEIKKEIVEVPSPAPQIVKVSSPQIVEVPSRQIIEVPSPQKKPFITTKKVFQPRPPVTKSYNASNKNITVMKPTTYGKAPARVINQVPHKISIKKESNIAYVIANENESYVIDHGSDFDSDAEIIEQSTVQYILCDGDPSDSELTFDELQASLQSFGAGKVGNNNKIKSSDSFRKATKFSPSVRSTPKIASILSQKRDPSSQIYRTYKGPKKTRMTNNLLQAHRKIKQEVEDVSYTEISGFDDDQSKQDSTNPENSQGTVKVKRSRKQQLTVVNRTDSEIIIQPALVFSEEEEEPIVSKKRGRRKKKELPDPDYNPRKPMANKKKVYRTVEVINIDVDDKDKANLSDKENDVISVEETDEEEEEDTRVKKKVMMRKPMMQCTHCMRNFRKRRALEKHVQICPKSPANIQKMEERKKLGVDKKFKCKSCDEYFDIAVSLARHVRIVHSPRKRGRPPKSWSKGEASDVSETEEDVESVADDSSSEKEPGAKRRGRPPKKRSLSKEKSPSAEVELRLESSNEVPAEPVKKRGRPPGRKSILKERSASSDVEDKSESESTNEPKKRGRPPKRSLSKEEDSEAIEEEEDKNKERTESVAQVPKKRGRPSRKSIMKEDEASKADEEEEEVESSSETPTEPKKRGRPSKKSISKDEEPKSSQAEDKDDKNLKKVVKETAEDEDNSDTEKGKLDKGKEPSATESVNKPEPKKRGRPPREKSISGNRPSVDSKSEDKDEDEEEEEEKEVTVKSQTGIKKRGRPPKDKSMKEEKPVESEEEIETDASVEPHTGTKRRGRLPKDKPAKDEIEEALENEMETVMLIERRISQSEPRRRGRPPANKNKPSTEDLIQTLEGDMEVETPNESQPASEPKRRGRPPKDKSSKDDSQDEGTETESEQTETKRKGRPPKEKSSKEESADASEDKTESEAEQKSTETRKRGRPAKAKPDISEDESAERKKGKTEVEEEDEGDEDAEESSQDDKNTSRAWKVKKLNCSECGRWFSSAAALSTHQLQHRTKKSGILVNRCQTCKKLIPVEFYTQHLASHRPNAPQQSSSARVSRSAN